jgi:hypothetical protein
MASSATISVPVSLLATSELLVTDKLVWMALDASGVIPAKRPASQTALAQALGLCRQTVAKALRRLEALGWVSPGAPDRSGGPSAPSTTARLPKLRGRRVTVAARLVLEGLLPARARLVHMLLAAATGGAVVHCDRYQSIAQMLHLCVRTARRAIAQLVEANWLVPNRDDGAAPVALTLRNAARDFFSRMLVDLTRDIREAKFKGEALLRGWLTVLVDDDDYEDEASPAYARHRATGGRLRFDRLYFRLSLAAEYNGPQHDHATELYDQEEVDKQRRRDAAKRRICVKRGIRLLVFHAKDLSREVIEERLRGLVPLRSLLDGGEEVVAFLTRSCDAYRAACARATAIPHAAPAPAR